MRAKWNMVHAANATAYALGLQRSNGFYVRRIVWGLLMARAEKREGEEIRAAMISVQSEVRRRKGKLLPRESAVV